MDRRKKTTVELNTSDCLLFNKMMQNRRFRTHLQDKLQMNANEWYWLTQEFKCADQYLPTVYQHLNKFRSHLHHQKIINRIKFENEVNKIQDDLVRYTINHRRQHENRTGRTQGHRT